MKRLRTILFAVDPHDGELTIEAASSRHVRGAVAVVRDGLDTKQG